MDAKTRLARRIHSCFPDAQLAEVVTGAGDTASFAFLDVPSEEWIPGGSTVMLTDPTDPFFPVQAFPDERAAAAVREAVREAFSPTEESFYLVVDGTIYLLACSVITAAGLYHLAARP